MYTTAGQMHASPHGKEKNPFQSETHATHKSTTNIFRKHLCNVFPFTQTTETRSLMPEMPAFRAVSQQLCPLLCSPQSATTRNLLWQLEMDECDLTWVMEHRKVCAGASGQGFLLHKRTHPRRHFTSCICRQWEDVIIRLVAILVPWGNGYEDKKKR